MIRNGAKWGQEDLFLLIQTVPAFLAILHSRFSGSQISKFLPDREGGDDGRTLRAWAQAWAQMPLALAPAPPDELSDPNLTPLPTHPGIK